MVANMLMLIRRELWEHKALYYAPLVVSALLIFGFILAFFTAVFTGASFQVAVAGLELTGAPGTLAGGSALLAVPFGLTSFVVAVVIFFYGIDALYAERKDKSILFWRSLPVTDTETVISKWLTAMIAAPIMAFAVAFVTQLILLLLASLAILFGGGNPVELIWAPLPFVQFWILTFYIAITMSLWLSPIIGWFLLSSAFAKRSSLLWVFVPVIVIAMLEGIVFRSGHVSQLIGERIGFAGISGLTFPEDMMVMDEDEVARQLLAGDIDILGALAPIDFLLSPGLWGGFIVTAAFLAGAVYFRRFRA
ncbi:MAG: hypothetical protein AAF004_03570 [Pseudomonadota bacterium]